MEGGNVIHGANRRFMTAVKRTAGWPGAGCIAILLSVFLVLALQFVAPKPDVFPMPVLETANDLHLEAAKPAEFRDCAAHDYNDVQACCYSPCSPPSFMPPGLHIQTAGLDRMYFSPAREIPAGMPNFPLREPPRAIHFAL